MLGIIHRGTVAHEALEIDLGTGFGEREVVRTEPGTHLAEHDLCEGVQGALEVGHGDVTIDAESLDLVKDRQMGGVVLIGTKHLAGAHDAYRGFLGEQGVDLHRAGGGTHALAVGDRVEPQGVLQGPGRMIDTKVEGVEVEPLRLRLRPLGHLPAHGDEDIGCHVHESGEWVDGPPRMCGDRQGDVNRLAGQRSLELGGGQFRLLGLEGLGDSATCLADALARFLASGRRERPDLTVGQGQR